MMAPRKTALELRDRAFVDHYTTQMGGGLPVFAGAPMQRGHGLGNVFRGLARVALPLLKKGATRLGKQALKTGVKIAGDALKGKNIKTAVRGRMKEAGRQLLSEWSGPLPPPPPGKRPIKRAASAKRVISHSGKRRKTTSQPKDIFS